MEISPLEMRLSYLNTFRNNLRSTFYVIFPDGLSEACRAAGVPVPERPRQTMKALEVRKKGREAEKEALRLTRLMLTEEQTRRILGISHIERGKDQRLITDEWLQVFGYKLPTKQNDNHRERRFL
jgi:hypothetical protein